ncbi:MAG: MOSC domain-containing protein [Treponema sp.]|jgi:molybdenum cofactor synthesis domain-containing protein|nr:MOSC domain-containing protein [Treponema sp.]
MGIVRAVCLSAEKGTAKHNIGRGEFVAGHGLRGDAHAGNWHRQVSLLSLDKINEFRAKGARVDDGAFGENLVVEGIDFRGLPVGTILRCGGVVLEMTQIGKECHSHCAIFNVMGDCIMPREGVFAKVLRGGIISTGDEMYAEEPSAAVSATGAAGQIPDAAASAGAEQAGAADSGGPACRLWIITASDKASCGEREDASGALIREIAGAAGYKTVGYTLLPDDQEGLENEMKKICDGGFADLVLTTGGTGLSPRDRMPEATLAVAERLVPGIPEALRAQGMGITNRAMLSRAAAAIRGRTLIINLPGSPRAVRENLEYIIAELGHGLDILTGRGGDCARP